MADVSDKDIQTAVINMYKIFFNLKEKGNIMKNGRFFLKNQLEVLEMKS